MPQKNSRRHTSTAENVEMGPIKKKKRAYIDGGSASSCSSDQPSSQSGSWQSKSITNLVDKSHHLAVKQVRPLLMGFFVGGLSPFGILHSCARVLPKGEPPCTAAACTHHVLRAQRTSWLAHAKTKSKSYY